MADLRTIWCCGCQRDVQARLTTGAEIYPHRPDLAAVPRWRCDCGLHVGCHWRHHDATKRMDPVGVIPTPEIGTARKHIHAILDPLWKGGRFQRVELYRMLSGRLGVAEYHTAEIRTVEEARRVWRTVKEIASNG